MKLLFWVLFFITWTLPVQAEKLHCPTPGTNDESNREIARRLFHMGNTYVGKNHRKTVEYFSCVLKLVPYSLAARYQLAKALDALKQYSLARENYELILSDTSVEASKYHEEIRLRLNQITKLPDEPLALDEEEERNPITVHNYQEKIHLQQERIRQLEKEKKQAKQQFEQQLKELEAQGGDINARRNQNLEEYKKQETKKIQELELQLARLRTLEAQIHSTIPKKTR